MNNEEKINFLEKENNDILKKCKFLMSGEELYAIPAYGWIYPIKKLCYSLEDLNYQYKKYGLKVVLSQSKEKFGGLRFYTDIIETTPLSFIIDKIQKILGQTYFGIKYNTDTKKLIPTKNKFAFKCLTFLKSSLLFIDNFLDYIYFRYTTRYEIRYKVLDQKVFDLIRQAENECENCCIRCGALFSYSKKCQTTGWITYICETCAKEKNIVYLKDNKKYKNGKLLKEENKNKEVLNNGNNS